MKEYSFTRVFILLICVAVVFYHCSKSAPQNNNNNNSNPAGGTDTVSILGVWLLDTMIVENITIPSALHNDTAYPIHPDSTTFTQDSVHTDSWMTVFNDGTTNTVSVRQTVENNFTAHYVKNGTRLVYYESGGPDTSQILKLTEHELLMHTPIPAQYQSMFKYSGMLRHYLR